jgi:hypothetical protein
MNARAGHILDMGTRALAHGHVYPDSDGGFTLSLANLEGLVARGRQAATTQREALVNRRTATKQKRALRRAMLAGPIPHLAEVGGIAGKEHAELGTTFLVKPGVGSYARFLTTARAMYNAAVANKEVLAKYGASESLVQQFGTQLDQFETAQALGNTARAEARGATFELREVGKQILQTVRLMDGRNRQRFENDPAALGAWVSARLVVKTAKAGEAAAVEAPVAPGGTAGLEGGTPAGDVRPAA